MIEPAQPAVMEATVNQLQTAVTKFGLPLHFDLTRAHVPTDNEPANCSSAASVRQVLVRSN